MSKSWPLVPLGEILTTVSRPEVVDPQVTYRILGAHWYAEGLYIKEVKPGSQIQATKLYRVEEGDFVYNRLFAWKGSFAVAAKENHDCYVSNEFPCFAVKRDRADGQYFWRYFSCASVWEEVLGLSSGGTPTSRNRLKEEKLLAMKIPLPPLAEQQRIVARIEELAAKIEEAGGLRRQAVEEAEELWKSGAREIFTALPQTSLRPLRELVAMRGGGTPSKVNPFFWEGSIPWISPKDMKSRGISEAADHISEDATFNSAAKLLDPGSVLIVVRGMILAHTVPSAVLLVPATINQDMKALIPDENLLPEYLCSALWALNDQLLALVEKSTHDTRKLETPKLLDFVIPVPSISEQRRIVAYLGDLQAKVDALKRLQAETATELDAMLPSVLDKAFKGEL
ncbi:MAG TPA: restriction endonuclease subunit S [Candidatus Binatia bacterium]|nr:restriction endonuclease subunit S [Candidatus Binatia bacterium]